MLAGVAAWLWPIGLGGRMPVGGDVTRFQFGLMAFLDRALAAGRLPCWNDLWGFGFPGLAESQMGVYYPPHLALYGLLGPEAAYTASFALHTFWAALGARWAARRFGASGAGAALSGFVFATCGGFVIHVTHQWGYTVGSWMPWAWGLGWSVLRGGGGRRSALGLAAVLALQVLPGHFQFAFVTQAGLAALVAWGWAEDRRPGPRGWLVLGMLVAAGGLAAGQLGPTWRLARLAEADRGWEYLSGFAASPLHLVSYVAPGLFHRSPLWRPLAWDPFHTSPEEHLAYVGLAPLFLALGAVGSGFRRDRAVRALAVAAGAATLLSLGPYAPGFGLLIGLPGFSFFRAPARWGLGAMLALALLAGLGFDRLSGWARPGRALAWFALLAALPTALVVLGVELAFAGTGRPGGSAVADAFSAAGRLLPWSGDPTFREVMAAARRPPDNPIVLDALRRRGEPPGSRLDRSRPSIYAEELGETAAGLAALALLAALARRPSHLAAGLAALAAADLLAFGHHRDLETAPIRPLVEQSPVLARLARSPRGTRTLDGLGNLPMAAGAAPLRAYRTLDLPTLVPLVALAGSGADPALADRAATAAGAGARIDEAGRDPRAEAIDDPALASWSLGAAWVSGHPASRRFALRWLDGPAARAWLLPGRAARPGPDPDPSRAALEALADARPLPWAAPEPERFEVGPFDAGAGPNLVVVSNLYDPQWAARWVGGDGAARPAEVAPAFAGRSGGWQAVRVPGPGRWRLLLEYDARAERLGLAASAVAWAAWLAAWSWPRRRRARGPIRRSADP
jgi:hypothetical protein